MKYLHEILWYLSWPLMIVISHHTIKWVLNKFEKQNKESSDPGSNYEI